MKKQSLTTKQERKMKFAEAGILITLVLALAIFVGTRVTAPEGDEIASADIDTTAVMVAAAPVDDPAPVALGQVEATESIDAEEPASIPVETISTEEAAPVTYAMAEKSFQEGRFEEAADLFIRYTADHEANAWGFYMLGLSEWKAGSPEDAEVAFQQALELKPDHLKSLVNYSRVLIAMDRNTEARTQIEAALALNPHSVDASRVMGRIQHNLGLLDEAAASYRTVLAAKNDDVWALNNLGLILIEQENFEAALAPLARASFIRGDVACIQNNLGIALERTGHYQAAEEAFGLALAAEEDYTKAAESLGRVAGLVQDSELVPVDLAALAESFRIGIQEDDMEVASALDSSAPVVDEPEMDGSRNR